MKKVNCTQLIVFTYLLICLSHFQMSATHLMGGDFTYTCVGPNQYIIQLTLYEDCMGSAQLPTTVDIEITSQNCNISIPQALPTALGPTVVTPLCPGEPDACTSPGGSYGIYRYIYRTPSPISLPASCTDWTISWRNCCRNNAITTLNSPGSNQFYIEAKLNNTTGQCNNSPNFLNDPTPFVCAGETVNYSHGVNELDGDSLVFSMVDCFDDVGNPVTYASGFSGIMPLASTTGVSINSATGAITFTPATQQVGVLCVLVEEYRNGIKIGEVVRDIQFTVLGCNNALPIVSGANGTADANGTTGDYDLTVCARSPLSFLATSYDDNAGDNITMNWNQGITNATLTVDTTGPTPIGAFDWTPTDADVGFHIFTINMSDDACPLIGVNIFTFSVQVLPVPVVEAGPYQTTCNIGDSVTLTGNTSSIDSLFSWSPTANLTSPMAVTTQASPPSATLYTLTKTYTNGCVSTDSVIVEPTAGITFPTLPDQDLCLGDTATFDATIPPIGGGTQIFSNTSVSPVFDADTLYFPINVSGVLHAGLVDSVIIESVCVNIDHISTSDLDLYLIAPNGVVVELSTDNGGTGDNYTDACFTPTATNSITTGTPPFTGDWQPEGSFEDIMFTIINGTWTLMVIDDIVGFAGVFNDWSITFGSPNATYQWTPTTGLITSANDPIIQLVPTASATYTVTATDVYGCTATQTAAVNVISSLAAPVVSCCAVNPTSLTFCWEAIAGATGYEVSLDGGSTWIPPNNTLSHQLTGLSLGQSITIDVRGISSCPGTSPSGSQSCTTLPCSLDGSLASVDSVSCNGGNDGTVTVTGTGGTTPYAFTFPGFPTQSTGNFNNIAAGSYNVSITDDNGCVDTVNVTVPEPLAITLAFDSTLVSCNSGNDGTATVMASNGTGTFTYQWDANAGNQTAAMATGLAAGGYSVTVMDANNCTMSNAVTVLEPVALTLDTMAIDISCNGAADGTAIVVPMGGTPNYSFLWSMNAGGQVNDTITELSGGTYNVTVTDANSCTATASITLAEQAAIVLDTASTSATCNGIADGTATVTATGGVGGYTYLWAASANGQVTATATGLNVGSHVVTVTDAAGCTAMTTAIVTTPPAVALNISNTPVTLCSYSTNGTATVTPVGGIGGYTYQWSDGINLMDSLVTGLGVGTHYITVTDANGCSEIDSTVIAGPPAIISNLVSTPISCSGQADATITVSPTGGTPIAIGSYTYQWSANVGGQAGTTITNLGAGQYVVTIIDANNCVLSDTLDIIAPDTLQTTAIHTNVSCFGGTDGTATALPLGGQAPFSYLWSAPSGSTDSIAANLSTGIYIVTVTDAGGCIDTANVTIQAPTTPLTVTTDITALLCNGDGSGTATALPTGGTPNYTYEWDASTGGQLTATATNLTAGNYSVTITDANGCITQGNAIVTEPLLFTATATAINASCFGVMDGTVAVTPSGGTGTITYNWSPSGSNNALVANVGIGWHYVTITDANGCTTQDSTQVIEPQGIGTTMNMLSVGCAGAMDGVATVMASGGVGNYTYDWLPSGETTDTAANLAAGWHYVTVTDANGCFTIDSIEVAEPTPLAITTDTTHVLCFGGLTGDATAHASGGGGDYTYVWNTPSLQFDTTATNLGAGSYTVTVTDANGCIATATVEVQQPAAPLVIVSITQTPISCFQGLNGTATVNPTGGTGDYVYQWVPTGIPGQTTRTAVNLGEGTYTVLVTDENGCIAIDSTRFESPAPITSLLSTTTASCFEGNDGTATATASGGTPGPNTSYSFMWNTIPSQQTATATGLSGGQTYQVSITDSKGCIHIDNIAIPHPNPMVTSTTSTDITCNGETDGTATVQATGGTPAYRYQWDANAQGQTSVTAVGLGVGTYSVTVTDTLGCTTTTAISIAQPPPLFTNTSVEDVVCKGGATGAATALVAGGTAPYVVFWDSRAGNIINSTVPGLAAGTYAFTVVDGNECTLTDSVTISEPTIGLDGIYEQSDVSCHGEHDGNFDILAIGGTPPYQYSVDGVNYSSNPRWVGLDAGQYTFYIRDDAGCTFSDQVVLAEPDPFTLDLGSDLSLTFGDSVTLEVVSASGFEPFTYTWTPANYLSCTTCPNPIVHDLSDDQRFSVTITDSRGCEAEDDIAIRVEIPRYVFVANAFTPNDDNINDVLFVQGGEGTERILTFQVYDRWGELVYRIYDVPINNAQYGWDGVFRGKKAQAGVYVWFTEVLFSDGRRIIYKGSTLILR